MHSEPVPATAPACVRGSPVPSWLSGRWDETMHEGAALGADSGVGRAWGGLGWRGSMGGERAHM